VRGENVHEYLKSKKVKKRESNDFTLEGKKKRGK